MNFAVIGADQSIRYIVRVLDEAQLQEMLKPGETYVPAAPQVSKRTHAWDPVKREFVPRADAREPLPAGPRANQAAPDVAARRARRLKRLESDPAYGRQLLAHLVTLGLLDGLPE